MKRLLRDFLRSRLVQRFVGVLAAEYLRFVWLTTKFTFDPPDVYERAEPHQPLIFAFWHGQHFMTPFLKNKKEYRIKVLISKHRDGEFNALALQRMALLELQIGPES